MTNAIPALARLGAGFLAMPSRQADRDWLMFAEERASRVLTGTRSPSAVAEAQAASVVEAGEERPWRQMGPVAVIPVTGLLMKDYRWIGDTWATGYAQLRWQVDLAISDQSVGAVVLWIDSPGGYVDGLFDFTSYLREARAEKPVFGIVDGTCASAAYAIGASTQSLSAGRFGCVGSVGVMAVHWDFSQALDKFGVVPTLLFAGKHKVEGNPFQPLPDEVRDRWLSEMEELRVIFADDVAAGRNGAIDAAAALKTEAAIYASPSRIDAAKEIGLIDQVMSPDAALAAVVDHFSAQGG